MVCQISWSIIRFKSEREISSSAAELSKRLARTARLFWKIRHNAPLETRILYYHGIFALFNLMVYLFGVQHTHPLLRGRTLGCLQGKRIQFPFDIDLHLRTTKKSEFDPD